MADRYWVGGSNTWNATAGTKWALTSGGAGGQAVPTIADNVFFDASSGAVVVTISAVGAAKTVNATGFTGNVVFGANVVIGGNVTWDSGMTLTGTQYQIINGTATVRYNNAICPPGAGAPPRMSLTNATATYTFATNVDVTALAYIAGNLNMQNIQLIVRNTCDWTSSTSRTANVANASMVMSYLAVWNLPSTGLTMNTQSFTLIGNSSEATNCNVAFRSATLRLGNVEIWTGGGLYFINAGATNTNITINYLNFVGNNGWVGVHPTATLTISGSSSALSGTTNLNNIRAGYSNTQLGTINASSGNIVFSWVTLKDTVFSGGANFSAVNSVSIANNTGITITPPTTNATPTIGLSPVRK